MTDRNTLAGVVRAHSAALAADLPLVVGCRLDLRDGPSFLCFPEDRTAYGRLCRLLTLGQRRAEKGACELYLEDVFTFAKGQVLVVIPPDSGGRRTVSESASTHRRQLSTARPYLAAHHLYRGDDRRRLAELADLSSRSSAPLVATNDVHYHAAGAAALCRM